MIDDDFEQVLERVFFSSIMLKKFLLKCWSGKLDLILIYVGVEFGGDEMHGSTLYC